MGSPKKDQAQTQQALPAWFEDASQWNIDQGRELAGREYTPYEGQTQAGFNPMQQDAFNSANYYGSMAPGAFSGAYGLLNDTSGQGMMGNAYSQMQGMFDEGGGVNYQGYNAAQAQAALGDRGAVRDIEGGAFTDMDRDAYTNQYTQGVSDNVFSDINRQSQQQQNQIGADASSAGAFGGSRHGVQGALQQSEAQRNYGQMSNQLNSQAFDAASGLMGQDLQRQFQATAANQGQDAAMEQLNAQLGTQTNMFNAGQTNQARGQNAQSGMMADYYNQSSRAGLLDSMMRGGQGLGNLNIQQGQALQGFGQSGMDSQFNAGNIIQGQNQQQLDDWRNQFNEARDWTANNFQYANAGMPNQVGSTTSKDVFSPNNLQQGISAGVGLAGAMGGKSHSSFKDIHGHTDVDAVANAILGMELYDWDYLPGEGPVGDEVARLGPLAEDFNKEFGTNPLDKMIDYQRHISTLHATIQSLDKRIKDLENN